MNRPKSNPLPRLLPLLALLIFVACSSDPVARPSAVISEIPTDATVTVGEPVTLSAAGSSDEGDPTLDYLWSVDAPDGSSVDNRTGSDETFTFTPDVAGDYTVTLTVTNDDGEEGEDTVVIRRRGSS